MERQMHEMRQEISVLKAYISLHPSMDINFLNDVLPSSARIEPGPLPSENQQLEISALPVTPVSERSVNQTPQFIQGSSSQPLVSEQMDTPPPRPSTPEVQDTASIEGWTPETPSVLRSQRSRDTSSPVSSLGKRPTPLLRSDGDNNSSSEESSLSVSLKEPLKRTNGHDRRCLTIQVCRFA